jgi:hypothetical protein
MNNYSLKWADGLEIKVAAGLFSTQGGETLKDFGCANGMPHSWFDQFKGKKTYQTEVGRCLTRYFVPEVGLTYTIDSSD